MHILYDQSWVLEVVVVPSDYFLSTPSDYSPCTKWLPLIKDFGKFHNFSIFLGGFNYDCDVSFVRLVHDQELESIASFTDLLYSKLITQGEGGYLLLESFFMECPVLSFSG